MAEHEAPRRAEWLVTLPSLLWLVVLFVVPTLIVFAIAFRPADPFGGIGAGLDARHPPQPRATRATRDPLAHALADRLATAVLCLLLAIADRLRHGARAATLAAARSCSLVIVPFWTSFLVRIFAWKVLLHPEGPLKHALVGARAGRARRDRCSTTPGAVLLVMVYTYLPFAILPIYAAAEKFDFRLLEAARDLGAAPLRAFFERLPARASGAAC